MFKTVIFTVYNEGMNDEYYSDDKVFRFRPTHIKKQKKPPFVREFGYYSPYLLNRRLVPCEREGYYHYYYMESYFTSHTQKVGDKYVKVYDEHVSKKSVEVTLEQWNKLREKDKEDFKVNRFEEQQLEFNIANEGRLINPFYVVMFERDRFDHEKFWINAFDLERVLNGLSDEDLDIYIYSAEKHLNQKQIAAIIGRSEAYISRRMRIIEDKIEYDMLDNGDRSDIEIRALMEYNRFMRTCKCDSFTDVYVYDFLLTIPNEMQMRYIFILRGQERLIKFCFLAVYTMLHDKNYVKKRPQEALNKMSYQLYKKHIVGLTDRAKQLFIALEQEVERVVRKFGLKDSKPSESFYKTIEKAAQSRGMTVAEYRDSVLFPHARQRIIDRFKKFLKLHPELKAPLKPPAKRTNTATKNFVTRKNK